MSMNFGQALQLAKDGNKVARAGWNGAGMYAVIMTGFPSGVPANKGTAELHKIPEGTPVVIRPYWALKTAQGDIATWAPSGSDVLAEDWVLANDVSFLKPASTVANSMEEEHRAIQAKLDKLNNTLNHPDVRLLTTPAEYNLLVNKRRILETYRSCHNDLMEVKGCRR